MGPQSENEEKLFSHRAHGQESISEEITNPQRLYLATCNLTSVVLTARERLATHIPPCSTSNGTNYLTVCFLVYKVV